MSGVYLLMGGFSLEEWPLRFSNPFPHLHCCEVPEEHYAIGGWIFDLRLVNGQVATPQVCGY